MSVFIDELSTDVRVDADDAPVASAASTSSYEEAMTRRMSDLHDARVRRRTHCEAFDD